LTPSAERLLEEGGHFVSTVSPLVRGGAPEEVAALVAFLLSDECPFLTGQAIAVNGGSYLLAAVGAPLRPRRR
jgi:NAD(P)-dependent dehydrogenase (short-subunit alcohol dehydrogenase family)